MMKFILTSFAIVVTLVFTVACVPLGPGPFGSGWGGGNMGGMGGQGGMGGGMDQMMGGGMMDGNGGMIGGNNGMMGGERPNNRESRPMIIDEAAEAVKKYILSYGPNLKLIEVMEFTQNFYAEIEEKGSGLHAMELLIDKYTGRVFPEMGPNMMWNTKYGMMANSPGFRAPVLSSEDAISIAKEFLVRNFPGSTTEEADAFYGYYTLHILRDDKIEGMLSVNAFSGQVWYHSWHGPFIGIKEFHAER